MTFRAATTDPEGQTYYQLLGVDMRATTADITRAYRHMMKACHPDRQPPARREQTEQLCKHLNHVYATLKDPARRKQYDDSIRAEEIQQQIMNRYVGGFAGPGLAGHDFSAAHLRREPTAFERAEKRSVDRSAMLSLLRVAAVLAAVAIGLLLVFALISATVGLLA